jgi:hypothetical protein
MLDKSIINTILIILLNWPLIGMGIKNIKIIKVVAFLVLICSLINLYFGYILIDNWQPDIPNTSGSRAMIFVPFIKYWPHILIGIGIICSLTSFVAIKNTKSFIKDVNKK